MKFRFFAYTAILLTFAGLISCQKAGTFLGIIVPVIPNENVNDFFQTHFSGYINPAYERFFGDNGQDNKCIMINSKEEFKEYISDSSIELPEIDFNLYTLIVGRYLMSNTTKYVITEQNIVIKRKKLELNMTIECADMRLTTVMMFYYWGVYPKLPSKSVHVNVDIHVNENLRPNPYT
ncbi:MAG: hypothetical protein LBC84_06430 [Prevotellaceae bacterium]|jgi:hypothetical protein|nr:hypothetical protein [Prevotellaceae bacterium]